MDTELDYINICKNLYLKGLKKRTRNHYTLYFEEDNFIFDYHSHSTAETLRVFLYNPETKEELLIWYKTKWCSSSYEFNEEGKIIGFQYKAMPWNDKLNQKFLEFDDLIRKYDLIQKEVKESDILNRNREEAEKLNRFRGMFV